MNRLENFISLVKLRTALIVSYGVIWTIIGCFSVWGISPRQALATAITDTNQTESYASTDDGSSSPLPSSELDAQGNLLPDSVASFSIIKADNDSLSDPNQPPPPNQTYNQTQSSTPTQNLFLAEGPDAGIPQPPAPTQDRSITSSQTQSPATTANKSLPASVPPSPGAAENSDCPDQNPPIYPPYSSLIASLIGQSFPIVKAAVSFFYLSDLTTPFYTTQADESGYFSLALNSSPPEADKDKDADQDKADQDKKDKDDEYILIAVSGGQVVDADNNGLLDSRPTPNTGSFHALVSLSQLTSGRLLRVSVLTDIVWRYTRHILNQTDKRGLAIRLEEIAKILLKEDKGDFDGDGVVKAADFLAFDPTNSHHWAGLNFDYQRLFTEDENGKSIINCYYQNNEQELLELLDKAFGALLTLYPTLGDKNPVVKIEVAPFGRGRVFEASGRLHFDSEGDPNQNLVAAFFDKNPGRKVVLTAEPIAETKILGWEGCDAVSADLTQCECQLDQDHTVRVSFGYKETKIVPNFIDLSEAEVIRDNYTLLVTIDPADSELQQKMAALTAGWYVVGSTGYGFLLKVVSVDKISDLVYRLETKEATLDEVVLQGTGTFSWKMTHKDLALPTATPVRLKAGPNSPPVWLLPSQDPNDKVFTLVLGDQPPDPQRQRTYSLTAGTGEVEVRLEVEGPQEIDIVVDGSLSLELQLDVGMSFSFFKGLESFRFIPKVIAKQNLSASLQAKLELFEKEKRLKFKSKKITLARLPFSSIKFFIGPVPVFITPQIEVLVGVDGTLTANIKAEIEFEESVEAGISYNKNLNPALTKIMNVPPVDFKPSLPHVEGGFELKFYLEPEGELLIYGVAGPAIPLTFFLALEGTVPPSGCVEVDCKLGIESEFKLLELNRKFGKYLGEIDIEIPLTIRLEWELGEWEFCDHAPGAPPPSEKLPHLEVRGSNVSKIIEYNYKGTISQTYQLINRGNKPLDWSISYSPDGIFSVSPQNGRLEGGESVTVTASVRGADLEIGKYKNTITFKNRSVSESFSRFFEITVNPPQIPLPTLRAAKILATKVILNWIVNNTENIDGYWLLKSTDPNPQIEDKDWDLAAEVPDKNQFSYKISKLSPDTVYYFMIIAYNKQGFESEPPPNLSSPPNFLKTTTSCYIQAGEETIQEAIDTVAEGKTLFVTPGVYYENIDFKGKSLTLKSTDPTNAEVVASTIIDGGQKGRVVTISIGKDKTAVLSGFTIRNGKATGNGGGILCSGNITISHCTISGNSASHDGGGIDCGGDRPATITISNCTISGNSARSGGGIWCNCYKRTTISNCTISGNSASWGGGICQFYYTNITNCILWANSNDQIYNYGHLSITYSNIQGGWDGEGNINADPLFADPEHGDYHLRPGSACINAGHPRMHDSDGSRIDMGAFGGGGENYPLMITYIVAADGSGNFSKIQEAIDSSISGDTIIVKAGLYQENLAIIGKEISLISQDGPEQTIIDGSKKERVICCIGRIKIEGFTIRNGEADGGGIWCSGNTTISHCIISGNSATIGHYGWGGGIWCSGNTTISNCTISGNSARGDGGGIYSESDSQTTISHCTISGNSGVGIGCSDTTISNCIISGNSASGSGGGIRCSDTTISNCIISGNSGDFGGISGALVSCGGGIFCDGNTTISNCTISGNSADFGGGIYCGYKSQITISNCTISENSASGSGGGIYCSQYSPTTISNCILWANSKDQIYYIYIDNYYFYSYLSITYSDIQGGWSGEGNINADPLFVDSEHGDYHLRPGSPCINAGRSGQDIPTYDLEGKLRDSQPDIGAFEFGQSLPSLTSLSISGPDMVNENSSASYTATATYSDGSTKDVTAQAVWSVSPSTYAAVAAGKLTTKEVPSSQTITITASYTDLCGGTRQATKNITIVDVPTLTSLSISGPDRVNEKSTVNYTATATYSDGTSKEVTNQAVWSVSPSTYAALAAGKLTIREVPSSQTITITASYSEGGVSKQATKSVTIVDVPATLTSLSISGPDRVNEKSTVNYTATATYSDGTSKEVTNQAVWSVSPSTYAALAAGKLTIREVPSSQTITITASYSEGGVSKQATKSVTIVDVPATLTSLSISGPDRVNEKSSASYTATATYSDGSTKEVTAQATWSVSPSTYAAVAAGKLTTKEVSSNQTITITASYTEGGVSKQTTKSATIVDVPATLTSLSISGPDRVNEKSSASYTATATYSDGSTKEVTAQATWSVSPSTYATIASGKLTTSGNLFTSQTVTITANYTEGGITKQANKTVTISVISVSYQFIPDTGQTQFYTDTLGEDSDYLINPPSYTKLDARGNPLPDSASSWSMVKDNVTGLIWEVKTDDGSIHDKDNTYTWQDAQDKFIAKLNAEKFGGYSDWRLPTVKELSMIVDSGRFDPAINTNYFPNTKSSPYWSSTSSVYSTDTACYVNFKDGYVFIYSFKTSLRYVRAVRGNSAFSTFVVNGDGTVTDTSTSLMWQQDTAGPMNWEEAINYCENLSLGGYTDWRLPNRNELQSLLDYNHFSPAIDATVFPNTANTAYWSSTTYAGDPECAWLVDFYQGNVFGPYRYNKSDKVYYVRAVREGGNILIRSEVIITFNMELTSNVNDLKSAITLARDGVDFRPLDEDDTAVIKGDTLILTVSPPLTGRKNSIRIAANALKDLNDNVVSEAITIDNLAGELEGEEEKEVPSLTGVSVSGPDKVNENSTANYTAKALFSDGTTQDVTSTAQWSVSPSTYAAVAAGKLTTREVPSSQIITITASYSEGGVSKQATKSVTIVDVPAILTSLSISGQDKVNEKSSASYSATAAYSDGSTKEVTAQATWSVSPSTYAALAAGKLTTKEVSSNQTITITASYSEGGVSKQATKNVTIVDIQPGGSTSSKCQEDDSGSLDIIGTSGKVGDEVQIAVRVQNVPAAVYSFGFELTYDPDVLEYQGYEAGDLTSSFLILSAAAVGSGRIRAGGLGDKYLARGASGKVIVLKFKVKGGQNGNCYPLRLEKLTDDISTFSTSGGYFCLKTCSGDLNEDGKITPSDALIVFKCYLGTGSCSERADVDGNGEVTPADALCLFRKYLGQPSCLD